MEFLDTWNALSSGATITGELLKLAGIASDLADDVSDLLGLVAKNM